MLACATYVQSTRACVTSYSRTRNAPMLRCSARRPRKVYFLYAVLASILVSGVAAAQAAPPVLYSSPAYESPVRGDPGDLLLIAGSGFAVTDSVVYQALDDTTQPLVPPDGVPEISDALQGVSPIVSVLNVPDSLTVKLPAAMARDQSYALWVRTAAGEWSNGIRINDARPLWFTPDSTYVSARVANLPRYLKVVGRNLQPAPGATTRVRLIGATTYTFDATNDGDDATAIERYVARVDLPASLSAGEYSVQVSRDGASWVGVSDQTLSVLGDPEGPQSFPVSAYGGCAPDDGADDTSCIVAAIAAAKSNGGGTVTFGSGTWNMGNSAAAGVVYDGILVPIGVNLLGTGAGSTTLVRDTTWSVGRPAFSLQGSNVVQGMRFSDARIYAPSSSARPFIQLGVQYDHAQSYSAGDPSYVSDVTVTQNVFDKPFIAVADGGLPLDHLYITYNEFGAYFQGLAVGGNGGNSAQRFHIDDAIVAFNVFKPGSDIDVAGGQGAIASGLAAGLRVDSSNNVADGAATDYLYDPATDTRGWRGGFLWALRGNNEKVLVSQNTATCTGDKAGDGEAILYDSSGSAPALPAAQPVLAASRNTVTVPGPLLTTQGGRSVPAASYYIEHWLSIAEGRGRGQLRKIVSYTDAAAASVTFTVFPGWDVIPQPASRVTISREYWQVYTVDNLIDQRQPLCQKSNANKPAGGMIMMYGPTAHSAIEGNRQYDTSGIGLGHAYTVHDSSVGTEPGIAFQYFNEIRGNRIDHEYAWASDCSWSGIQLVSGASPTSGFTPPPEGYGVSIAHNLVTQADGMGGGAIQLTRSWYGGPPPATWNLIDNTLIFGNTMNDVTAPTAATVSPYLTCSHQPGPRVGARLLDATMWRTVLSDNSCNNVAARFMDGGSASQRVCSEYAASNSCECASSVQSNSASPQAPLTSLAVLFPLAQVAGNLNLVAIVWGGSARVLSVTDTSGNAYVLAVSTTFTLSGTTQAVYYAKNIAAAASNAVSVTFNGTAPSPIVRVTEYSGIDAAAPLDVATGAPGGWVTTTNANDLLVTVGHDGLRNRIVTAINAYAAEEPDDWWGTQLVAFRMAGGGGANTQTLSTPAALSATATSDAGIDLNWSASSDNIGVTGYLIERCQDPGCADFSQIAKVSTTTYSDSGLTGDTTYRYRVRATDVAALAGGYSAVASATTQATAQ